MFYSDEKLSPEQWGTAYEMVLPFLFKKENLLKLSEGNPLLFFFCIAELFSGD